MEDGAMDREGLQTTVVGETRLAYVRTGVGQPLIFIHGIPTDYRAWDAQLEPFSRKYDVISYSRRLARPNQNKEEYAESTIENNSADLIGLIQNLGLSPAHLVGHSFGGFIAAYSSAMHPEHVRTLTLVEPAVSTILLKNRRSLGGFLGLLLRSPSTAISAAKFQRNSLDPSLAAFNSGDFGSALRFNVDGIMNRKNALDTLSDSVRSMMKDNEKTVGELSAEPPAFGRDEASKITAPVLLMNGSDSPKVLHTIVERLAKAIPKSEVARVSGSAHFPHIEKPEEFNRIVLDFLAKNA
jgi:pimeloyl-ACP methyl ester carboxylesterase